MRDGDLLIIGFGNPLRGDDGLGWRAAERLAAAWYGRAPQAELITVAGARFDFSEDLSPAAQSALENVLKLVDAL